MKNKWPAFVSLLGLLALLLIREAQKPQPIEMEIDTYIPLSHVLVPIELRKNRALAGFSGDRMIVDLFSGSKKVLEGVKLLRSPKDHNTYAALIEEGLASQLVLKEGPFRAALRNPKDPTQRKVLKKTSQDMPLIEYLEEP